jgi:DeoR family transcriptional regulator, deoxyribose operon repressor
LSKDNRIREIVNLVKQNRHVEIKELKERLDVSEMTIRRDLSQLANDNVVKLIPGGAVIRQAVEPDEEKYQISHEGRIHTREKVAIGQKACALIEPDDAIILDIGSTTEYVAKLLREDVPLTVLCCTINNLVEVYRKKNCNIIFPGGYLHANELMFESPEGIELIRRTRADKAFVSAAGVHAELGITTVYPYELETKRAILHSARSRILLADSSKFGNTRSVYFADLKDFNVVITDSGIPDEYRALCESLKITLHVV